MLSEGRRALASIVCDGESLLLGASQLGSSDACSFRATRANCAGGGFVISRGRSRPVPKPYARSMTALLAVADWERASESLVDARAIQALAEELGISPAIVAGRVRWEAR